MVSHFKHCPKTFFMDFAAYIGPVFREK